MPTPLALDAGAQHSGEEELALVRRIADGDRGALERLYGLYHRRLFRFLIRFADRHGLVEEIINDTLFTVWRKAGEFRAQSSVSTWIIGIAYRRALKSLKRQDLLQRVESEAYAAADDPQGVGQTPDEDADWLAQGLAQLPPEQRLALELAYFFGHSCEEIAEITACPVNTVKTRMFNARRRLRELLPALAEGTASPTATGSGAMPAPGSRHR
jgi:RNA polymerase sigma-70 factor (ECF subfamily)